jgi:signal transduction histidine kinase/serine/threonine protein kinase
MAIITSTQSIPGYQICSLLYSGTRTLVYRALRESDSAPVVVKLLSSSFPTFNELVQFRNQYIVTKNLNIPGIIRPISLDVYGNGYILVMEDTGGISLQEYIKTTNISLIDFLEIAIQLTDTLRDLHQNCIIHKDIKPANILIQSESQQVKLIDFSIASLLPKETQEIINPNVLEGTLAYIAPEQTGRMNRGIDYRSDFYSLGITFYELITGQLPFNSNSAMEWVHSHIAQQAALISDIKPEIPQTISNIVGKLIAKNAEDRYQTTLGLKHDLEKCLNQIKDVGKIADFQVGERDLCERFLIPEKLLNEFETISAITHSSIAKITHSSTKNTTSISNLLDLQSVIEAAQVISGNIQLDDLVTNLTQIILENSGAKKSVLILPGEENTWKVRAITILEHENKRIQTAQVEELIDNCDDIPRKIINYVKNTSETLIINNCQTDLSGLIGEYILKHQPKSLLCTPILRHGEIIGILYLENKLVSGVFSQERLLVINLLSSQAAISLENAHLYKKSQQALQDLQQAQIQIVQSEKMSALGNLVAGVAHEMNNPLGFISATIKQIKPSFEDVTTHLQLYQQSFLNPGDAITEHAEEIDLDYTLSDVPKMIDGIKIACDRLQNISTSLRTFSRADRDYKVKFNIHDGIDSTILILKHRLKANEQRPAIEVTTEYGDLSQFECFPGQLNQVFMNILANAIDALDEFSIGRRFEELKANPNKINIKTSSKNKQVIISITDNGKGMSKDIQQRIFDHLFTTKLVGKGTGLGLAIAKQIIEENHGGKLSCNSTLGKGTEFIITIPI